MELGSPLSTARRIQRERSPHCQPYCVRRQAFHITAIVTKQTAIAVMWSYLILLYLISVCKLITQRF